MSAAKQTDDGRSRSRRTERDLAEQIEQKTDFETFFDEAPVRSCLTKWWRTSCPKLLYVLTASTFARRLLGD